MELQSEQKEANHGRAPLVVIVRVFWCHTVVSRSQEQGKADPGVLSDKLVCHSQSHAYGL